MTTKVVGTRYDLILTSDTLYSVEALVSVCTCFYDVTVITLS